MYQREGIIGRIWMRLQFKKKWEFRIIGRFTCDAALAKLSKALVIASACWWFFVVIVSTVSVLILQSIRRLVVVLDDEEDGGERKTAMKKIFDFS
jgi:hypothetical protein